MTKICSRCPSTAVAPRDQSIMHHGGGGGAVRQHHLATLLFVDMSRKEWQKGKNQLINTQSKNCSFFDSYIF